MDFQIKHIRAFLAVVEQRSFSQAADKLGYSQPTVTQHVQALEERIGFPLLVRSARAIELLPEAEELIAPFQRLVGRTQRLDSLAESLALAKPPPIVTGLAMYSDWPERTALLSAFVEANPAVHIHTETDFTEQLYAGLEDAQFDLVILLSSFPDEHFEYQTLRHFSTEMIVPKGSDLAKFPILGEKELGGRTFASFYPPRFINLYEAAIRPLERMGAQPVYPADQSPAALLTYAKARDMIFVSAFPWLNDRHLEHEGYVRRPVAGLQNTSGLMLVRSRRFPSAAGLPLWEFTSSWLAQQEQGVARESASP